MAAGGIGRAGITVGMRGRNRRAGLFIVGTRWLRCVVVGGSGTNRLRTGS